MTACTYRDITIRGVTYATVAEAARALGVEPGTVRRGLRLGWLDRVGAGLRGCEPLPVCVRGKVYPSARAAARALGLQDDSAIFNALRQGREDRVGLPAVTKGSKHKPVRIGPLTFPSRAAADRALGFRVGYVGRVLRRPNDVARQALLAAALRLQAARDATEVFEMRRIAA